MKAAARGIVIAAPASGSGKTTVTLALLRHLRDAGRRVASLKIGPDYIDPAFHAAASGRACLNLDPWAMRGSTASAAVAAASAGADVIVAEGVMGLFDGATAHEGSTADAAAATGWPVVLVVDAGAMAASAAAVVRGFADFRGDVDVAGVIYNRIGSDRHAGLLVEATAKTGIPVLGCIRRDPSLALPDRHLGLVQAAEHPDLERFLRAAARTIGAAVDVDALMQLPRHTRLGRPASPPPAGSGPRPGAAPVSPETGASHPHSASERRIPAADPPHTTPGPRAAPDHDTPPATSPLPVLGQHIAVARDEAFAFAYPLTLDGWRRAGAELSTFSPLAGEAPSPTADAVYLPGGYPELHAGRIAAARRFLEGLRAAADRGATIYGECGGYMVLGERLIDADGEAHAMAGLLPVMTTFAERGLTLGYRAVRALGDGPLGHGGTRFRGHEFHYARILREDGDAALFRCADARGRDLGTAGHRIGTVAGSFVHLVDRDEQGHETGHSGTRGDTRRAGIACHGAQSTQSRMLHRLRRPPAARPAPPGRTGARSMPGDLAGIRGSPALDVLTDRSRKWPMFFDVPPVPLALDDAIPCTTSVSQ